MGNFGPVLVLCTGEAGGWAEKGEHGLTFIPMACVAVQGRLAVGMCAAHGPCSALGSQGCTGEPSLLTPANGPGYHGAKG